MENLCDSKALQKGVACCRESQRKVFRRNRYKQISVKNNE